MVTKTIPDKHTAPTYLRRPTTNDTTYIRGPTYLRRPTTNDTTYIRGRSSSTTNDYKKFNFIYMQSNKINNGLNKP